MAGKFIELKAAAKQLGITIEQLQELREAGKIHGYKDGASWKFKPEEVARLASELSAASAADAGGSDVGDSGLVERRRIRQPVEGRCSVGCRRQPGRLVDSDQFRRASRRATSESSSTVIGKEKAGGARPATCVWRMRTKAATSSRPAAARSRPAVRTI